MGSKVFRIVGFVILAVIVFRVVLQQSSAAQTQGETADSQIQIEPGSAGETQIRVTRVVYVTATPQPTVETAESEGETASQQEIEPLAVVSRDPHPVRGADLQPTFQLTFNKMVNQMPRTRLVSVEPQIPLTIYWESGNILLVRPAVQLEPETMYTFSLLPEMTALDGSGMSSSYTWTYVPYELMASPRYRTLEDGRGSFQLMFNYPIDPASVEWQIYPETEGELVWSDDFKTLTFEGASVFQSGRTYTIGLGDSLRKPDGMPAPSVEEIRIDMDELLADQSPEIGGYNVNPLTTIEMRFRRDVDMERVEAGLVIDPAPVVGPEFDWQGNTLMAEVVLMPGQPHTVRIESSDLIDSQGRSLSHKAIIWNFRTGSGDRFAGFGEGPRFQSLQYGAGAARPVVEYSFLNREHSLPVTFELYEMSLAEWQANPILAEHDFSEMAPLASWEEPAPPEKPESYFLSNQTPLPEGIGPGFYRLRLNAFGMPQDDMVIALTDLGLAVRKEGETLLAWVVDLATLTPVSAEVTVYRGGQILTTGTANEDGLLSLTINGMATESELPITIVARSGERFALAAINYAWQSHYASETEPPDYLLHLSMDRPLYRPGETAYVRAVLRESANGAPAVMPPGQTVTVTLSGYDANYDRVASEPVFLTTDEYGVAYGEIAVPADFATHHYNATADYRGVSSSVGFSVAEGLQEDAPIVTVETPPIVGQGDELDVEVRVTDSNGRPLADETVNLTFLQQVYDNGGCYWSNGINEWFSTNDGNHTGRTDGNGMYAFSVTAEMGYNIHRPHDDSNMSHSISAVIARVSQEDQTGTGYSVFEIAGSGEEIVWQPSSMVQAAGQPFVVQGRVVDLAGAAVAGRAVTVQLHEVGENGIHLNYEAGALVSQSQTVSDGEGRVLFDLNVERPGYYQLQLTGVDRFGNLMKVFRPLYVTGEGEATAVPALQLGVAAKENYAGHNAQLVILAEQPGPALLTIGNRDGVRSEMITLTGQVTVIDLPLTAADSPALNVEVDLWVRETADIEPNASYYESAFSRKDGDYKTRSLTIPVIDLDKQLQVSVVEGEAEDANGQTAVTVRVLNGRGEPVSAEVALSIASQSLYSHFPDHNRPQYGSLFRSTVIQQTVFHSLEPQRDLSYMYGGGCGCGGGWWGEERLPAPANDMPVFWFPGLHTDHNGEATVLVTLPDNPDGWHFSAEAITADGQVGEGE